MADRCLCYTTNCGYAFPTLVSAAQARSNLSPRADVVIVLVGASRDEQAALAEACRAFGVALVSVPRGAIDDQPINFARHFLGRLLDARYRRVVHVDGDTQVLGSLDALLDAEPPAGRIIAAPDPMALMADASGAAWERRRAYFVGIGIGRRAQRRYVNTGMFSARREDLADIGGECLRIVRLMGDRLAFSEQDALNLAFEERIDLASMRWNHPAFFASFALGRIVEPRLRHFMSNPRPWQGSFPPWGPVGHAPYVEVLRRQPQLGRFNAPFPRMRSLRYSLQQRFKRAVEPHLWDRPEIHARLRAMEASAIV